MDESNDNEGPTFRLVNGQYHPRVQTGEWEYEVLIKPQDYDDVLTLLENVLFDVCSDVHSISANSFLRYLGRL